MSDPIDFIDLTVDSPKNKRLRIRNKNVENIPNNSTTLKSRTPKSRHKLSQLEDSVVEITPDNASKDVQAMEIIDLDNYNISLQNTLCYVNDSTQENSYFLTCPICYEQLSSKIKPISTRCGHIFCTQCLQLALAKAKRCPTCQKATKLQACTRLYF